MPGRTPFVVFVLLLSACDGAGRRAAPTTQSIATTSAPIARDEAAPVTMGAAVNAVGGRASAARSDVDSRMVPLTVFRQPANGPMLLRAGRASLQVDSLETGMTRVRELARQFSATIGNTSVQSGRTQLRSATLELRVVAERFDDLVGGLQQLGTIDAVDVTVADVGEEFVDVTARVATARQLERRLLDLLATRTGKLADVIQVERELARVREEIERYEGRLRYLRERAAISTLAVTVHEPIPVLAGQPGTNPLVEAARTAWRNFVLLLATCIASLGLIVPIAGLGALVVVARRRWVPRSRPVTDVA